MVVSRPTHCMSMARRLKVGAAGIWDESVSHFRHATRQETPRRTLLRLSPPIATALRLPPRRLAISLPRLPITVSGYVSALFDEGQPTQTNVTSIFINGVAAVLGTNIDANGNLSFTTTNAIPLSVPITGFLAGPGIPTDPPPDPPAMSQVYEVTGKASVENLIYADAEVGGFYRPSDLCGGSWIAGQNSLVSYANVYDLSASETAAVDVYASYFWVDFNECVTVPDGDRITNWGFLETDYWDSYSEPARALMLGSYRGDFNSEDDIEAINVDPYEDQVTASVSFRAPRQYDTNTTVIFTFEGMDDTRPPPNALAPSSTLGPLDLSQVKYLGQSPFEWDNEAKTVSYVINVDGGREYTINRDSFDWPVVTTNYFVYEDGIFLGQYTESVHSLQWTNFHNAHPEIIGSDKLVSTMNAAGSNVTLTATNYPSGGTFQWSTTSTNIQFVGSTTSLALQVSPIQAMFTPPGSSEVVTLICTFDGGIITNTFKMIVQHPTSLQTISEMPSSQGDRASVALRYQILDQNAQPLRCVVTVGSANIRLATLKASETLAWQCGTSCSGAQSEVHDANVADDGTFADTQSASTACGSYVRSQVLYVGILNYSSQDNVAYKCICFDGSEFRVIAGTADGTACCSTCVP